jgi:PadR family transcriptional regulator PadR
MRASSGGLRQNASSSARSLAVRVLGTARGNTTKPSRPKRRSWVAKAGVTAPSATFCFSWVGQSRRSIHRPPKRLNVASCAAFVFTTPLPDRNDLTKPRAAGGNNRGGLAPCLNGRRRVSYANKGILQRTLPCTICWIPSGRRVVDPNQIQLKKGVLELCVLALLSRGESYAYDIAARLAEAIDMGEGTIYPLMRRMQTEGLVDTYLVESSSGPPRKYYRLTGAGRTAFDDQKSGYTRFARAVATILEEPAS